MSDLRFDMLILAVCLAGAAIAAVYLFMLAMPRNDDEHLHDAIGEPGHIKTWLLRGIVRLRRRLHR